MADADRDILIVGAGPLGLSAGLRLAAGGQRVRLFDTRSSDEAHLDKRMLALSHGSRQLLEQIGAWPLGATPIHTVHVSQRDALGRTEMRHSDYGLPALGYVVPAAALMQSLLARAKAVSLDIRYDAHAEGFDAADTTIALRLRASDGTRRAEHGALVACCEGRIGEGEPAARTRDYDQFALLLRVTPAQHHANVAWERFTPEGPIALLPQGGDYGVVWTVPPARLQALLALQDDALLAALQSAFGTRVRFDKLLSRGSYPLSMRVRKSPVDRRVVWLGNAAQTLHPVAGQGFNLGLRDVWELAESLRASEDPGSAAVLQSYAQRRRADRMGASGFTDGLVRLFSNDNPLLRHARGAGLLALDVLPPLRHFVTKRMIFGARAWP